MGQPQAGLARQDRGNGRREARPLSVTGWSGATPPEPRPRRTPVADLFEETLRLYRDNFVLMLGISAVLQLPLILASLPFAAWQAEWITTGRVAPPRIAPEQAGAILVLVLLFVLATLVLSAFQQAALAYIVARARNGDPPPAREVALAMRRLAGPLLGYVGWILAGTVIAVLLVGLVMIAIVGIFAVAGVAASAVGLVTVVILIACFVALIVATVRLSLSIPALVLERLSALNAFRRSWALTNGATLRTLGILILVGLVVGVVAGLVNPFFIPGVMEGVLRGSPAAYALVTLIGGLAQLVVAAVPPVLLTVLYFDYARAR